MRIFIKMSLFNAFIISALFMSCSKNEVTKITLNKSIANYTVGQKDSLISTISASGDIAKNPQTWITSNSAVATVKNGLVTAINTGTTTITVQAGDKSASCIVTIVDKINPVLTQGVLGYYGDVYGTIPDSIPNAASNNFVIYLAGSSVNLNNYFAGTDDRLMIEVNASTTMIDSIPSGTYDMMTELTQSKLLPYSIVPAYTYNSQPWGSWYYGSGNNAIVVGNIVVSQSKGIYTILYNMIDYYGNTISGTYNGSLIYFDGTVQKAPAGFKNKMQINSSQSLTNFAKLKRRNF